MIDSLGLTHRREKKNSHIQTLTHPDIYLHKLLYQWRYRSTSSADVYLFICILIKCQKINISFLQETDSSTDWSSVHKPNLPFDNPLQEWVKEKENLCSTLSRLLYLPPKSKQKKIAIFIAVFIATMIIWCLFIVWWHYRYAVGCGINIISLATVTFWLNRIFFLFLEKCILIEFCVFSKYDINLSARLNFKLFFSFDLKRNINDKINMNPYLWNYIWIWIYI